jgi:hypothetical protein
MNRVRLVLGRIRLLGPVVALAAIALALEAGKRWC